MNMNCTLFQQEIKIGERIHQRILPFYINSWIHVKIKNLKMGRNTLSYYIKFENPEFEFKFLVNY